MIKNSIVALVTPFDKNRIDFKALGNLIDLHLSNGTSAILLSGTTGESVNLSREETIKITEFAIEKVNNRVPIILGVGSNSTQKSIENTKIAFDIGIKDVLTVVPYYNKPTQQGLYEHFKAIANSAPVRVILYNVPGRTSCNLLPSTVSKLSNIDNIVGIKEASGDIEQLAEMMILAKKGFAFYSGDDALILPQLALNITGVISVVANIIPKWFSDLFILTSEGKWKEARELYLKIFPLIKMMFIETNPIPVKTALHMMGFIKDEFRLPLCQIGVENRERLKHCLKNLSLIK